MAFKLSAITWSHHYSFELGLIDDFGLVDLYAKEGLSGIEFIDGHLKSTEKNHLLKLKKYALDKGLSISAISAGNSFGQETDEGMKNQIEYVKKNIDIAETVGVSIVRVFAGWADPKKQESLWQKAVEAMKECGDYAKEKGIVLAVEPHNHGGFLPDSEKTLKYLKDVNSEYVKLNLDTGNYMDKNMYKAIENTIEYAVYCHVKIHKITKTGFMKDFDLDKIFKILSKNDYRGWLSIEYEGQEFLKGDKKAKANNEKEFFKVAVKKVKNLIKKYY